MKYLRRIPDDLRRGENIDLYVAVLAAILVAVLSLFGIVPQGLRDSLVLAVMALLTSSMLGIRHRLETLDDQHNLLLDISGGGIPIEEHDNFSTAFHHWIEPYDFIDEISIVGYTSSTYLEHTRMRPQEIGRARILLFFGDSQGKSGRDEARARITSATLDRAIQGWQYLCATGRIEKLEIRRHQSRANFYFSIVNRDRGLFGLLWPSGFIGLEPRKVFTVSGETKQSRQLITHAIDWFEAVWEQAQPIQAINHEQEVPMNDNGR